jgi:lactococcin 972 family bacteriocin
MRGIRMKIRGTVLVSALVAAALVAAPATAASAATSSVGGGLWDHGAGGLHVYSHYHHGSKYHSATACDGTPFHVCTKAVAAKGKWANADRAGSWSGNTAYWATY